tara:strand:- start:645 stop:779 length:135 start_codon:yes stop_codon:yes gene_type:complete
MLPELHHRAKIRACEEGKSLQEWIENIVMQELERKDSKKIPCEF